MSLIRMLLTGFVATVVLAPVAAAPQQAAGDQQAQPILALLPNRPMVTVYGDGLAFVRDTRKGQLEKDRSTRLIFPAISRELIAESVRLDSVQDITLFDISYERLTPETLRSRSVGKEVDVFRPNPGGGATVERATLLSAHDGILLKYGNRIEIGDQERIGFLDVPEALQSSALGASVESNVDGEVSFSLAYLTTGLSWTADYIVEIDDEDCAAGSEGGDKNGKFRGRAMVTNTSGSDYRDAALNLIAGRVQRVSGSAPPRPMMASMGRSFAEQADAPPGPVALGDTYAYPVAAAVTLLDQQQLQLRIEGLSADAKDGHRIRVDCQYVSRNEAPITRPMGDAPDIRHPRLALSIDNTETNGLGEPLAEGVARVYRRGNDGELRFLGEDRVEPLPAGQTVRLSPSEAFDISVTRSQTDFVRAGLPDNAFESAYRIKIDNAKETDVTVKVIERIEGDWQILDENRQRHADEDQHASQAVWKLLVPAGGQEILTYRVRVQL